MRCRCQCMHVVAEIDNDLLWRQWFATIIGWASSLATAAGRTGVEIEELLPGKVLQLGSPEAFRLFEVGNRLECPFGFEVRQEGVDRSRNHMKELRRIGDIR